MQQKKGNRKQAGNPGNRQIAVNYISGGTGTFNRSSIGKDQWITHHGVAANGTPVNSMKSYPIRDTDTIVLKTGSGAELDASKDEVFVFAEQYLIGQGCQVIRPSSNTQ